MSPNSALRKFLYTLIAIDGRLNFQEGNTDNTDRRMNTGYFSTS